MRGGITLAKKNISKSVRMTDEVYGIVQEAPGSGFSEKFENIILRERRIKPELDEMQRKLEEKRLEVYRLTEQYSCLDGFYRDCEDMCRRLGELRRTLEKAVRSGTE